MKNKIVFLILVSLISLCFSAATVYEGSVTVTIENQQTVEMKYKITVNPQNNGCQYEKCFVGWVSQYEVDGNVVKGYYNPQLPVQPIFKWNGNSQSDYSLIYPSGLDQAWKSIIELWSEKFNPFSSSHVNQVIANEIPVQDTQMTVSKHQARANYESDGTLKQSNEKYSFSLANQNLNSEQGSQASLNFIVQHNVKKTSTVSGGADLRKAEMLLRTKTDEVHINQIKAKRSASNSQPEVDIEPDIDLNLVNNAKGTDTGVDPEKYFSDPYSYPGLNKQNPNLNLRDNVENAVVNQVNTISINQSFIVLNQSKTLHSATVFGKKLASQTYAFCELTILPQYTLNCEATFTFNFLGKNKTLTIANFSRSITQTYYTSTYYHNGAFIFKTKVPLPYPVDYMTFTINVNISYAFYYYAYAGVYSYYYPYRYYFYSYYYPYGNITAQGDIQVGILEAGAKINGQLINAFTYQYTRFSFYFITGQIEIYLNFYAYLYYFQYTWGYFWRYYIFFVGWSPLQQQYWTQGNTFTVYKSLANRTWSFSIYN